MVVVGQIVNRKLLPLQYQPSNVVVVHSPVEMPTLAELIRKDWAGLSPAAHRASLLSDLRSGRESVAQGALTRLAFYYPRATTDAVVRLFQRSLYDADAALNCANSLTRLAQGRSIGDRALQWHCRRQLSRFASAHGGAGIEAGVIRELRLDWNNTLHDLSRDRLYRFQSAFENQKHAIALRRVLIALLGLRDRIQATSVANVATPRDQVEMLAVITRLRSNAIDEATLDMFRTCTRLFNRRGTRNPISTTEGRVTLDELALACATRLAAEPRYDEVLLPWCNQRVQSLLHQTIKPDKSGASARRDEMVRQYREVLERLSRAAVSNQNGR
jgi:hypothetical protein